MSQIIQCVPNFSEGRNPAAVEAIVNAVRAVGSVGLIDYSYDPDHNRSVVTFLGGAEGVRAAAFAAVSKAAELIDMREHTGAHPCIGAADVIPVVPVKGITVQECVDLSYRIGSDVAGLGIPVYFYERSAVLSHRTNLADVRRGGYERLAETGLEDDRAPDLGPSILHPTAGATVVGARAPLVAYNVNLDSEDMEVASAIVRKIRSGGAGLRGVKALSVWLASRSRVQVSMNVTQPDLMPIHRVFGFVEAEAGAYGVGVAESEVIGVVSRRWLDGASPEALKITGFKKSQILENWL